MSGLPGIEPRETPLEPGNGRRIGRPAVLTGADGRRLRRRRCALRLQGRSELTAGMYSRDEVKAITDKVIDMAKADAVEVEFNGGERSATRFANSNITANMVQFDRTVAITVYQGNKSGTATVRDFDDATLRQGVADAAKRA